MQRNLNAIDGNSRSSCTIITGVPETEITSELANGQETLSTDASKVKKIIDLVGNQYFKDFDMEKLEISRIGKVREANNRAIKVKFLSIKERDEFLRGANKLKDR